MSLILCCKFNLNIIFDRLLRIERNYFKSIHLIYEILIRRNV